MTSAKPVARRRTSIARSSAKTTVKKSAAKPFDPATLPKMYALSVIGDCMEPAIADGAEAIFSKAEKFGPGDIVVIWFRPEVVKAGMARCAMKRLTLAPPPWVTGFPYQDNPGSDVGALLVFEQDNPRLTYSMKCSDIAAVHKFTGCQ
jgi:Peptidase S24-like